MYYNILLRNEVLCIFRNKIDRNKIILKCIPITVLSILASIILLVLIGLKLESDIKHNIEEINNQISKSIKFKLNIPLESLKGLASKIANEEDEAKRYDLMTQIHEFCESTLFASLHCVDKDGYTICEDEKVYLGNKEHIQRALRGESVISSPTESKLEYIDDEFIIFEVPISVDGKIIGAVGGLYKLEHIQELLVADIFDSKTANQKVKILLFDKNHDLITSNITNTYSNNLKETIDEMIMSKDVYTIHKKLLDDNSWHLLSVTPKHVAFKQSYNIMKILSAVMLLWTIILFILKFLNEKKEYLYNQNLKKLAYKDSLTGINNYEKFILDVEYMLKNTDDKFVMICFDIKKFKFINQVFSYSVGDDLLKQISKNIPNYIRGTYKYTRVNNDIFAIFMKVDIDNFDIEETTEIIRKCIVVDGLYKYVSNSNDIKIDTSIGIYFIEDNKECIKTMVDYANFARQKSKKLNTNDYCIFDHRALEEKKDALNIEKKIHLGLKSHQFKAYYQPKVCTRTNKVVGAEALIRWILEDGSFVRPDEFIPIAESNGSIHLIGRWIFIQVCKDLKMWSEKGYNLIPISVNISRLEFYQSDLVGFIKDSLEKYDIDPRLIEIEITETTALNDIDYINNKIRLIKELGVKVSMDDFGTGNSTLSNLKFIPIDTLKIDRSLSLDIETNEKSRHMLSMIISMAKTLGHDVVCEGIEYLEQVDILKDMNCDMIQGFVFYKPMCSNDIENIIKEL